MDNRLLRTGAPLAALLLLTVGCGNTQQLDPEGWQTFSAARQHAGEERLDIRFEYAAGRINVRPTEEPLLYRFEARYHDSAFRPVHEYDAATNRLALGVESEGRTSMGFGDVGEARAALELNPEVPVALALEFGAGDADLQLGGLAIRTLDVSTGASRARIDFAAPNRIPAERIRLSSGAARLEATGLGNARAERMEFEGGVGRTILDFSGAWERNATASVAMGMGSLELRLPRDLGVRIDRSSALSRFRAPELVQRGESYYSANWDEAPHRLSVRIEAALGSIDVNWID